MTTPASLTSFCLLILLSFLCFPAVLPAAPTEKASPADKPTTSAIPLIKRIEISGNKRSTRWYIEHVLGLTRLPTPCDNCTEALRQRLLLADAFSAANVRFEPPVLRVEVEEKFTTVAAPFAMGDAANRRLGLGFIDLNVFGTGTGIILKAEEQNNRFNVESKVTIPYILPGNGHIVLRTTMGNFLRREFATDKSLIRKFDIGYYGVKLGPAYTLPEMSLTIMPRIGFFTVYNRGDLSSLTLKEGHAFPLYVSVLYDTQRPGLYKKQGLSSEVIATVSPGPIAYEKIEWINTYNNAPIGKTVFGGRFYGSTGHRLPLFENALAGGGINATKLRGRPSETLWGKHATIASLSCEYPLYMHRYGTLASELFHDAGIVTDGRIQKNDISNGTGLGIRFYLAKIAVPAFGLDATYSYERRSPNISLMVGVLF